MNQQENRMVTGVTLIIVGLVLIAAMFLLNN